MLRDGVHGCLNAHYELADNTACFAKIASCRLRERRCTGCKQRYFQYPQNGRGLLFFCDEVRFVDLHLNGLPDELQPCQPCNVYLPRLSVSLPYARHLAGKIRTSGGDQGFGGQARVATGKKEQ